MKFRFTLRDWLWLSLVIALVLALVLQHQRSSQELKRLNARILRISTRLPQEELQELIADPPRQHRTVGRVISADELDSSDNLRPTNPTEGPTMHKGLMSTQRTED